MCKKRQQFIRLDAHSFVLKNVVDRNLVMSDFQDVCCEPCHFRLLVLLSRGELSVHIMWVYVTLAERSL